MEKREDGDDRAPESHAILTYITRIFLCAVRSLSECGNIEEKLCKYLRDEKAKRSREDARHEEKSLHRREKSWSRMGCRRRAGRRESPRWKCDKFFFLRLSTASRLLLTFKDGKFRANRAINCRVKKSVAGLLT